MNDFDNVGYYMEDKAFKPANSYYFEDKNLVLANVNDINDEMLKMFKLFMNTIFTSENEVEYFYKHFLNGNGTISSQISNIMYSYLTVFIQLYSINQINFELSEKIEQLSISLQLEIENIENGLIMLNGQTKLFKDIMEKYYVQFRNRMLITKEGIIDYDLFEEYIQSFLQDRKLTVNLSNENEIHEQALCYIKDIIGVEVSKEILFLETENEKKATELVKFISDVFNFLENNTEKNEYSGEITVDDYITNRYAPRTLSSTEQIDQFHVFMIKYCGVGEVYESLKKTIVRIKETNVSRLHSEDEQILKFGNESILGNLQAVQVFLQNAKKIV